MAIYKTKKFGFIKNRLRDAVIIGAFFLGYKTHDSVDYYINKVKEYNVYVVSLEEKMSSLNEQNEALETKIRDLMSKEQEEANEPRTRYRVRRERRVKPENLREQ